MFKDWIDDQPGWYQLVITFLGLFLFFLSAQVAGELVVGMLGW